MKKQNLVVKIPVSGSLGILAAGHTAVTAWRKVRDAAPKADNVKADKKKK